MSEGFTPPGLDDILNSNTDGPVRDERGRFAPKAEALEPEVETGEPAAPVDDQPEPQPEVTPTPEAEPEPQAIPFKALKDERAKRQTLEQELAAMRAQLEQMRQPQPQYQPQPQFQPEADEVPDPVIDPQAYAAWVEDRALARINMNRVAQTAQAARGRYQDFDQVAQAFQQMAQVNPMLEQMMLQQPDPAEWAYRTAKTHLEVAQYGGLEAAVEARVKAALEEEMAKLKAQAAKPAVPPSIASERNVASRTNPVPWAGPPSLESILSR